MTTVDHVTIRLSIPNADFSVTPVNAYKVPDRHCIGVAN